MTAATQMPLPTPRLYGTVRLQGRVWAITAEPHVMGRLRRLFTRISKAEQGTVFLSATAENTRELRWFIGRYPMNVVGRAEMDRLAAEHIATEQAVARIVANDYTPPALNLAIPPRDYQRIAAHLLLRTGRLLLADDLGLGKTCSAIATLSDRRTLPALVVTMTHLPRQWAAEIAKFAPGLKTHIVKGTTPYDLCAGPRGTRVPYPDVVILNYHKLAGWAETLAPIVNSVVFDEVQELRVPKSQKYSAATHVADRASFRMGLSATPIYNQAGEMYHVLRVLAPEALGTFPEFTREWCGREVDGADRAPGVRNPEAFGQYLREQGLMLRRTRAEVGRELPDLTRSVQYVDTDTRPLDDVAVRARELAEIILAQGGYHPKVKLEASEELSWRLRQATGVAKAEGVAAFVRVLVESGERVVLYGWHKAVYDIWRQKLSKLRWTPPGSDVEIEADPVFFTGEESEPQKAAAKAAFIEGKSPLLIMSLRAGAGLDGLQHVCRTVVFGELDWSPGVHEQCGGRVHRDGQNEPVVLYFLVSDGGSDPTVMDVLGLKKSQSDGVRDPNGALVAKLDRSGDHIKRLASTYLAQRRKGPPS